MDFNLNVWWMRKRRSKQRHTGTEVQQRKNAISGTKPYAHSTNSPKLHGRRRNLLAELEYTNPFSRYFHLKTSSHKAGKMTLPLFLEVILQKKKVPLFSTKEHRKVKWSTLCYCRECSKEKMICQKHVAMLCRAPLLSSYSLCFKTFSSPLGSNTWRVTEKWHFTEHSVYDNCH